MRRALQFTIDASQIRLLLELGMIGSACSGKNGRLLNHIKPCKQHVIPRGHGLGGGQRSIIQHAPLSSTIRHACSSCSESRNWTVTNGFRRARSSLQVAEMALSSSSAIREDGGACLGVRMYSTLSHTGQVCRSHTGQTCQL